MSDVKNHQEISVELLVPFKDHPFEQYVGQRFEDMVASVRENGVLVPIIVRASDDGKFEILSGHNRVAAAKQAGIEKVSAVVREGLTDDEAMFIVTETNLIQRSFADMKHSERAVVLATHYDAIKKKSGYRSDLLDGVESATLVQVAPRLSTSRKIGEQHGLSADTIKRYLRVNKLLPELKTALDNEQFGIVAAVSLSYLNESEQQILSELLGESGKINMRQAEKMRKDSESHELSEDDIKLILNLPKVEKTKSFKVKSELMDRFFSDGESDEDIQSVIEKALAAYLNK